MPPAKPDRWGLWFSRLIQVVALVLIVHQALVAKTDRMWLLLVLLAMLLGTFGVELVVRYVARRLDAQSTTFEERP